MFKKCTKIDIFLEHGRLFLYVKACIDLVSFCRVFNYVKSQCHCFLVIATAFIEISMAAGTRYGGGCPLLAETFFMFLSVKFQARCSRGISK